MLHDFQGSLLQVQNLIFINAIHKGPNTRPTIFSDQKFIMDVSVWRYIFTLQTAVMRMSVLLIFIAQLWWIPVDSKFGCKMCWYICALFLLLFARLRSSFLLAFSLTFQSRKEQREFTILISFLYSPLHIHKVIFFIKKRRQLYFPSGYWWLAF